MGHQDACVLPRVTDISVTPDAPNPDEVEITLLGPGYGESILVHIGHGKWIVVDSCISDAGTPQALDYLSQIGMSPEDVVELIVATHWHDDHIRGMAELVRACQRGRFCCGAALRQEEFLSAVGALGNREPFRGGSGVQEIYQVFSELQNTKREAIFGLADRRIHQEGDCEVWTLSPHDSEFTHFLKAVEDLFPKVGQTKKRVPSISPNNVSVVVWVRTGETVVLLGADLEANGWVRILNSGSRPQERATAFKIPHHGALSAHEPTVWREMLEQDPVAILTPWRLANRQLPTQQDMKRILTQTSDAHATTRTDGPSRKQGRRASAVARTIREANIAVRRNAPHSGGLRLRKQANSRGRWSVSTFGNATHLRNLVK